MTFAYVSVEEAIERRGGRMVVVGNVPSPWGEAAKGILHIKAIDWAAVRLVYVSEALQQWAGQRSGPVLIHNDERPRSGWAEILPLAERLAPSPPLLPAKADERALAFGLAHESAAKQGWGGHAAGSSYTPASTTPAASSNASPNIWPRSTATPREGDDILGPLISAKAGIQLACRAFGSEPGSPLSRGRAV
jgi:hypothetical protein